ncbi:MAG: hypothetical protein HQL53_08215 [Magnetococcales bacterium]|nr:hypothetical protein [Magnetococcales bacterium]
MRPITPLLMTLLTALLVTTLLPSSGRAACRVYRVEPALTPHKHVGEKVTVHAVPAKPDIHPLDTKLYWVVQKFRTDGPNDDPNAPLVQDGQPNYVNGTSELNWKFPEQAIYGVAAFFYDGVGTFDCPTPFSRVQVNKAHNGLKETKK